MLCKKIKAYSEDEGSKVLMRLLSKEELKAKGLRNILEDTGFNEYTVGVLGLGPEACPVLYVINVKLISLAVEMIPYVQVTSTADTAAAATVQ